MIFLEFCLTKVKPKQREEEEAEEEAAAEEGIENPNEIAVFIHRLCSIVKSATPS